MFRIDCEHELQEEKQLPPEVKAKVANLELGGGNLQDTLDIADSVWSTFQGAAVSAVEVAGAGEDVAAFGRQKATGAKKSKGAGGAAGSAGQQQKGRNRWDKRSPEGPPEECCQVHWQFGSNAYFCKRPGECPWETRIAKRTAKK